jgi:hypothetical protein
MSKWLSAIALACVCAACGGSGSSEPPAADAAAEGKGDAATTTAPEKPTLPAPEFREVTIPVGTTLRLELKSALASDTSQIEDSVRATLRQPVTIDGKVVLPAGTQLVGTVTDVARAGRVKGVARVAYRFTTLRHDSERYDIRTAPIAHEAKTTKKKDAVKIGIGAGAGAAIGAILGGGGGAAKGAAIGGAGGTGAVLATRGDEVRLGPGADVNTRLMSPLTVRVKA